MEAFAQQRQTRAVGHAERQALPSVRALRTTLSRFHNPPSDFSDAILGLVRANRRCARSRGACAVDPGVLRRVAGADQR